MKQGLLALVAHAGERGWSTRRSCGLLGLDPDRLADWRARASCGRLADLGCGGGAVHGLLDAERAAIVELFESWAGIDRSHRKLAARGSRLDLVHVSASTVHRVLGAEGFTATKSPLVMSTAWWTTDIPPGRGATPSLSAYRSSTISATSHLQRQRSGQPRHLGRMLEGLSGT